MRRQQLLTVERLGDVVVGPQLEAAEYVLLHGLGGEEDDGRLAVGLPHFLGQFEAAESGHHHVENAQVPLIAAVAFQSGHPHRRGEGDVVIVYFEEGAQYVAEILVVFDEQDLCFARVDIAHGRLGLRLCERGGG